MLPFLKKNSNMICLSSFLAGSGDLLLGAI